MKITVKTTEHTDKAIKLFKRNCSSAGILRDFRSKSFFEKPTAVNRKAKRDRLNVLKKIQTERSKV